MKQAENSKSERNDSKKGIQKIMIQKCKKSDLFMDFLRQILRFAFIFDV